MNYYLCNGYGGYFCIGGDGIHENCSALCGDAPCGDDILVSAWEGIAACGAQRGFPVVEGPLPLGTTVWFGSQSQLQRCLNCASP